MIDLSDDFVEYKQIPWSSLSKNDKIMLRRYEHWQGNKMNNLRYSDVPDFSHINSNILIGGERASYEPRRLKDMGVDAILNMAIEIDMPNPPARHAYSGIECKKIGIEDGKIAPLSVYPTAADIINENVEKGGVIYVHCAAGISRSVTAVTAYLISRKGMGFMEALQDICMKRPCAAPHPLLVRSLIRDLPEFKW